MIIADNCSVRSEAAAQEISQLRESADVAWISVTSVVRRKMDPCEARGLRGTAAKPKNPLISTS